MQQAVHVTPVAHIGTDLTQHAFLSPGQVKGQVLGIEGIEQRTHFLKHHSTQVHCCGAFVFDQQELAEQELFKFHAVTCSTQALKVLRSMDVVQGRFPVGQGELGAPLFREEFGYVATELRQNCFDDLANTSGVQALGPKLFSTGIHRLEGSAFRYAGSGRQFKFRVGNGPLAFEKVGLTKHHILLAYPEFGRNPLGAFKPHELNLSGGVFELGHQTLLARRAHQFCVGKGAFELDVGGIGTHIGNGVETALVHVPERNMQQQVLHGADPELGLQLCSTRRTYAFDKFYGGIEQGRHGV